MTNQRPNKPVSSKTARQHTPPLTVSVAANRASRDGGGSGGGGGKPRAPKQQDEKEGAGGRCGARTDEVEGGLDSELWKVTGKLV